jgi:hypothetical protein
MLRAVRIAWVLSIGLAACSSTPNTASTSSTSTETTAATDDDAQRPACCAECKHAASRDPTALDLRAKPCAHYREGISDACRAFFQAHDTRVGDCAGAE